jgi:hypothetical protein
MLRYLQACAVAATLCLAGITQVPAGGCAGFGADCGCGPALAAVQVVEPCRPLVESYLVNQGPVFSGPGHYLRQLEDPAPCCYPYVGFVYSGYPYGAYGPGGYPRGSYGPYAGYPYAERYPYGGRLPYRGGRPYVTRSFPLHYRARHVPVVR